LAYQESLKRSNEPVASEEVAGDMLRQDGTTKSTQGFLGPIESPKGTMTEFSVGVELDGKEMEIPTLVPTLTNDEIETLKQAETADDIPDSIMDKAVDHAKQRIKEGKSPFYQDGEEANIMDKIAMVESSNQHTDAQGNLTKSSVGALGKYQIMPETAKDPGYGIKPIPDLEKASEAEHKRFATEYFQAMLNEFDGDEEKALAAYNGGPTTVKEAVKKYGVDWKAGIPLESKNYIQKVASL
jgi:soluble lytic murein transglycosylase-like protein